MAKIKKLHGSVGSMKEWLMKEIKYVADDDMDYMTISYIYDCAYLLKQLSNAGFLDEELVTITRCNDSFMIRFVHDDANVLLNGGVD